MSNTDVPQVEPLTLTLEQALARLGARGYILAVYGPDDAPKEYVLRDVYSPFVRGSFGHWKDAVEAVLGVPVVPRDDIAELVAAIESGLYYVKWAEDLGHMAAPSSRARIEAVLARVKNTTAPVTDSSESEVID